MKQAIQVVGFKNSGKSTLIRALSAKLREKGHKVTVIKNAHSGLKIIEKDSEMSSACDRYIVASDDQTMINIPRKYGFLQLIASAEGSFIILEGFKELRFTPRIVCLNDDSEKERLADGTEIAFWKKDDPDNAEKLEGLAELVIEKGFMLAALNCGGCGHPECAGLLREILAGKRELKDCLPLSQKTSVEINGTQIPLSPFVADILRETFGGFIGSLKGATKGEAVVRLEIS